MSIAQVSLSLPDALYERLLRTAQATKQALEEVILHALRVGSPPAWDDAPPEFQADLAALDRMDDEDLYRIARSRRSERDLARQNELLDRNGEGLLDESERAELARLREEQDLFVLRKAHAAALLRWRGRHVPAP